MFDCTNDGLFTKGMESQLIIYLFGIVKKTPHSVIRVYKLGRYKIYRRPWYNLRTDQILAMACGAVRHGLGL